MDTVKELLMRAREVDGRSEGDGAVEDKQGKLWKGFAWGKVRGTALTG